MLQKPFKEYSIIAKIIFIILLAVMAYFPIFMHLDVLPLQPWDEALFAIRAYYFAEYGEAIQSFAQLGLDDYPNSKPVFFTMVQALFYKIFGYNELALRLPVALSFLASCIALIFIGKKVFNTWKVGFLAGFILLTSPSMYLHHMARFGDQDIPFMLMVLLMCYNTFYYIENHKTKHLLWSSLWFLMAFYTKSVAVFVAFPGVIFYLVLHKKWKPILKQRNFWLASALVGLALGLNYFSNVGHLGNATRLVQDSGHKNAWYFHFTHILQEELFTPWLFFMPLMYLFFKQNRFIQFVSYIIISYFTILSIMQTKIYWYSAPVYPFLAIVVAFVIYQLYQTYFHLWEVKVKQLSIAMFILLCVFAYGKVIDMSYKPSENNNNSEVAFLLKKTKQQTPEIKKISIIPDFSQGYSPQLLFYTMLYQREWNYDLQWKWDIKKENFNADEIVLSANMGTNQWLEKHFKVDTLNHYNHRIFLFRLNEKRP